MKFTKANLLAHTGIYRQNGGKNAIKLTLAVEKQEHQVVGQIRTLIGKASL